MLALVALLAISAGCRDRSEPRASAMAAAGSVRVAVELPPEPAPPVAQRAAEVPALEAKLAADKGYQGVWKAPRPDLNAFLTYVSELIAEGGSPGDVAAAARARKVGDAGVTIFLIVARVGRLPDELTRRVLAHLEVIKGEPHLGVWSPPKKGQPAHDFTALAAWLRPGQPGYLRERLAAKKAGPIGWSPIGTKEPPLRPWLSQPGAALTRLALLGPLVRDDCAAVGLEYVEQVGPTGAATGVCDKKAPPKADPKADLPPGTFRTRADYVGASTREKLDKAMEFVVAGDREAFDLYIRTEPGVFLLRGDEVVSLVEVEGLLASRVQVRKRGAVAAFWTVREALVVE